jgi:hypothetical protein
MLLSVYHRLFNVFSILLPAMQEDFLAYVWQHRLFSQQNLVCESGESLEILHPGIRNQDSGPDYFNAKLKIGGIVWIGNVELHVRASDWLRHKHHYDAMYENVILHVVHENDTVIYRRDGSRIPELNLRHKYKPEILDQYLDLIQGAANWVPCEKLISDVPRLTWHQWLAYLITQRLDGKTKQIKSLLEQTGYDWEEAFYRQLARCYGFRVNNEPFYMLAASLPLQTLRRHRYQPGYTEALLFGQAGFLHANMKDAYGKELFMHYKYLRHKNNIVPIPVYIWKFGRLRPANFPTRRIAQFAALIDASESLFSALIHCNDFPTLVSLLQSETSGYWKRHYRFDEEVPQATSKMGEGSAQNIIVNAIVPFLYYYGRYHQQTGMISKAVEWLGKCLPEDNAVIRGWAGAGVDAANALESQALLFLRQEYCLRKKCVTCSIGQHLLKIQ